MNGSSTKMTTLIEKPFNWSQIRRLFTYMKPYRKQLLPVIIVTMVLGTLTRLAIPALFIKAIDDAIQPKDGGAPSMQKLYMYAGIMLALYIIQWASNTFRIKFTNMIGQQVIFDLRHDLFRHIQKLSFRFFDKRPAGSVLVRVTNDVNALQELFTNGVVNLLMDMRAVGRDRRHFARLELQARPCDHDHRAADVLRLDGAAPADPARLAGRAHEAVPHQRAFERKHPGHARDAGVHAGKVKFPVFRGHQSDEHQSLEQSVGAQPSVRPDHRGYLRGRHADPVLVRRSSDRDRRHTVGLLVAFANYVGNFWEPINRLGQMYSQLLIAMASSERIFEFIDEEPTVGELTEARSLPRISATFISRTSCSNTRKGVRRSRGSTWT